jgi:hypothetical protein
VHRKEYRLPRTIPSIATLVHRYEFEFAEEGFELAVLERINANPGPLPVKLRRRTAEL